MKKLIEIAKAEIGVCENPPQSNVVKYNDWFYGKRVQGPNYAWCGTFFSWCYAMAGIPLGTIDYLRGISGVPYGLKNVSKWGKLIDSKDATPGCAVIYDWDGNGTPDHIGMFLRHIDANYFEAIEGNTSLANQSNGGEVMLRKRAFSGGKMKVYFIRPNVLPIDILS